MKAKWQYALPALVLAVLSWYLVAGRGRVETWIELPVVVIDLPGNMSIREGAPTKIEARISGPGFMVRNLEKSKPSYAIDARELVPGRNVHIFEPGAVRLPAGLNLMEFRPVRTVMDIEKTVEVKLPVRVVWKGELDSIWELKQAESVPAQVTLRGPWSVVRQMQDAPTSEIRVIGGQPVGVMEKVQLDLPEGTESEPSIVEAKLLFGERMVDVWVKLSAALPEDPDYEFSVDPEQVRLHLEVPVTAARDSGFRQGIRIDLPEALPEGSSEVTPKVSLPENLRLLETNPERITVIKKAKEK